MSQNSPTSHSQYKTKRQGFTLIELSIVLVIIGLIVGGVLVGRDLIQAAKLRAQISQVEKLVTAVHTFRLKYNCLPGDCKSAVALGLGTNSSWHNGDGNKQVGSVCFNWAVFNVNTPGQPENHNFFYHLARAGLVAGEYGGYEGEAHATVWTTTIANTRFIKGQFDSSIVVPSFFAYDAKCTGPAWNSSDLPRIRPGGHGFVVMGLPSSSGHFVAAVSPIDMASMDSKIDDGLALTGSVGIDVYSSDTWVAPAATNWNNICSDASGVYPSYSDALRCKLLFLNRY